MTHDGQDRTRIANALAIALATVRGERAALEALEAALEGPPLRDAFSRALTVLRGARGRVITTGVGKSGIAARKAAATLMSTGTPAAFLHASEAAHGDLGMVASGDVVLALSWSGETPDLAAIVAHAHLVGAALVVATSQPQSSAGRSADVCLPLPRVEEACPNRMAPTASTAVQLALADALALALADERGFTGDSFRRLHPGGQLGARDVSVGQLMGTGEAVPVVAARATLMEATVEMSRKRYGCTAVVDEVGALVGMFTDGDLRRSFAIGRTDAMVAEHMTPRPLSVSPDMPSTEAVRVMNDHAVTALCVSKENRLLGMVHFHDVVRAGIA